MSPMPTLLPPGTVLVIGREGAAERAIEAGRGPMQRGSYASVDQAAVELREALRRALAGLPADSVILLSGGIDSAAIAAAAPARFRCLTWTTAGAARASTADSDFLAARRVADHLGTPHDTIEPAAAQLRANVDLAVLLGEVARGTLVDDLVVYLEVARTLRAQGVKTIVIGEAADDAIGCLPINLRLYRGQQLLDKLGRDYELGATADHAAISKVFGAFGIEVIDPYLSAPVAQVARRLTLDMRVDPARLMKPVLRKAFRDALPLSVVERPKLISRDGSGVRALMEDRFGTSRDRFLPVFKALFRDPEARSRQEALLSGMD